MVKSLAIITLLQVFALACETDLKMTVVYRPELSEEYCLSNPEKYGCPDFMESLRKEKAFKLEQISPINSFEGHVVRLKGDSFDDHLKVTIEGQDVVLVKVSDTEALFFTPSFESQGLKTAVLKRLERSIEFKLFILIDTSINPTSLSEPSQLCEGTEFMLDDGSIAFGTKACANTVNAVNCSEDGEVGCITTPTFAAADTSSAANKILAGETLAGVSGNVTLPAANKVLTGNSFGVSGTGLAGSLTLPSAQNVWTGAAAYGDSLATVMPTLTLPAVGKVLSGTAYGVAGTGSAGTLTLPAAGNVLSSAGAYGETGSAVTGTIGNCAANGSACYVPSYVLTTQPLRAISYDAIDAGKASMRTSLTLGGITGTLADCNTNAVAGCVTTASYQSADLTNLAAGNIKRGISLAGITGNFPSAASPIPRYTDSGATIAIGGADITDLTMFSTQLTTDGSFEFWDSTGKRGTGSGDSELIAANVKSGVELENLSITGTASPTCTADGQTACTTTGTYPAVDTTALTTWDIRTGKSAGGISGSLAFYKNMAKTSFFDRSTGTAGIVGLDIYDTIDDFAGNTGFPTQNNAGWNQLTSAGTNWTTVVANTVSKDNITQLFWLKDQGSAFQWEQGITQCEDSTSGGRSDWRLPTLKELHQAIINGIYGQTATLSLGNFSVWASSTVSYNQGQAWSVAVNHGATGVTGKGFTQRVICVAP